ncbi:MAG: FAD-dependent oxidoreductase [Chlamydiales bacterium]
MEHFPFIVLGAGAGGLVVAIGVARAGKRVLLIEKGTYGGDCTNFGCIPSKSLIASANAYYAAKEGVFEGVRHAEPLRRVRDIVAEVRSHEEPAALHKKGIETLTGIARFLDSHMLSVQTSDSEKVVLGDQIVIATGSSPLIPNIEGIEDVPYLTNETIFDLDEIPKRLCVLGGGPIGSELAQAFNRLGSKVMQIHRHSHLLKREEREAQAVLEGQFKKEGIELYLNYQTRSVRYENKQFTLKIESEEGHKEIQADAFLVAVGRAVNIKLLQLEAAGVKYTEKGIIVDKYGRTNKKHIWAIGDVVGGAQFTHVAENHARSVLASLLLPFNKKISRQAIPRTTYTDPEIASFGLLEKQAKELYGEENIMSYHVPMSENDRAITAGRTEGFVKVVTKKMTSRILGATLVGPRAGEMLPELSLAAKEKIPLRKIGYLIHPYPTYNLAIRRCADLWLTQVFLPFLRQPFKGFPWKRFLPLTIIVLLMIVAYASGVHKYLTFDFLKASHANVKLFVMSYPILSPIVYIIVYAIVVSLSLPGGAVLSLLGGLLFHVPLSTLYVLVGATTGACVIFLAARTAFREVLARKAGPFLKKMEKGFNRNAWSYLLFLRFIPLFPFWLVNIAPAFFNVSFLTYLWTTFVGIIPGAYVYTQTGEGLSYIFETGKAFSLESVFNIRLRIALIALAIFALVPTLVKRWVEHKKKS